MWTGSIIKRNICISGCFARCSFYRSQTYNYVLLSILSLTPYSFFIFPPSNFLLKQVFFGKLSFQSFPSRQAAALRSPSTWFQGPPLCPRRAIFHLQTYKELKQIWFRVVHPFSSPSERRRSALQEWRSLPNDSSIKRQIERGATSNLSDEGGG
jgi:hypothetical protein